VRQLCGNGVEIDGGGGDAIVSCDIHLAGGEALLCGAATADVEPGAI